MQPDTQALKRFEAGLQKKPSKNWKKETGSISRRIPAAGISLLRPGSELLRMDSSLMPLS